MSGNPQTVSEISANPSKLAVTHANDATEQQADVERKLKLYGVVQGFMNGSMPDNQQINEALDFASSHSPVELSKLSPDGKVLVEDVRDIIETARVMVAEKNANELLQNFLWATTQGDISRGAKSKDELLPVSKGEATAQGKQAAAHLRVLFTLFATNSEARKLLKDAGFIARDLFTTGAANLAENVRPHPDALAQVDKPAPHGEFISEDGRKVGKDETPKLHVKGPGGSSLVMDPKADPNDIKLTGTDGQQTTAGEAYDKAQQVKADAQQAKSDLQSQGQSALNSQGGTDGLKSQAKSHLDDVRTSSSPLDAAQAKKDQASSAIDDATPDAPEGEEAKKSLKDRIPQEYKDKAKEHLQKTKDFLNEEIPEERRQNFIYRLKKVVVECQDHKDYQEAMSFFLDTAENYHGHAKNIAAHGADSVGSIAEDPAYTQATLMFRALIERFANNQSSQPIIDAVDDLYTDSQNDSELRAWWSALNEYIHRALLEPGYIMESESDEEAKSLIEKGKSFFTEKYKGHFDAFSDAVQTFFTAMGEDPLNKRFGDDWKRLIKDLLFDADGNLSFKPKLWNDIRRVILPQVIAQIGYVPIPRAEYSDKNIDLVIENLVLQGPNLFPNILEIESFNKFAFSPYGKLNNQIDTHHHKLRLGFSQIQADMRDVQFGFRKHGGFPKISDSGLADVLLGGKGLSGYVEVESVEGKRDSVFRVSSIKIDIDTLKFSIRDSKHDLLYKFIKTTATGIIRKAIEAAMHTAITTALENLDDQLAEVRNRMEDAKQSDETTRTQALKDIYAKKKQEAEVKKEKAQEVADRRGSTFKLVLDPNDSIVQDVTEKNTKNSWARRALHVQEAAASGATNSWKSPVFSLFAKEHPATTGVPHPAVGQTNESKGLHTNGV